MLRNMISIPSQPMSFALQQLSLICSRRWVNLQLFIIRKQILDIFMDQPINNYLISEIPMCPVYSPLCTQTDLCFNSNAAYSPFSFYCNSQVEKYVFPVFPFSLSPETFTVTPWHLLGQGYSNFFSSNENEINFSVGRTQVHDPLNPQGSARIDQSATMKRHPSKNKNVEIPPKVKHNIKDKQYLPNRKQKQQKKRRIHENQNRNIIPNEINQIISFIQKRNKSGFILQKIILKEQPNKQTYNINRFYLYQSQLKEKIGHYTNEESLRLINQLYEPQCRIWDYDEQRYYNKLCRLLIRHFLLEDSIFNILTSKRMKSQKKIVHLRARRAITEKVLQVLKG